MKTRFLLAMILLFSGNAIAADGPKVFIESVSQPHQQDSLLFRGKSTTEGQMAPASQIERVLAPQCGRCVFIAKKERADYIMTFANTSSGYEWSVIDNAGDGNRIASKKVILEANAYSNAIEAVKADWAKKNGPEVKVIKWELPENVEGVYEVKVSPDEVGSGAVVRIKVMKP